MEYLLTIMYRKDDKIEEIMCDKPHRIMNGVITYFTDGVAYTVPLYLIDKVKFNPESYDKLFTHINTKVCEDPNCLVHGKKPQ